MKNSHLTTTFIALFLSVCATYGQTFEKRINCGSTTAFTHNGDIFEADISTPGDVTFDGERTGSFNLNLPDHLKSIRFTKNANREMFYNITVPQAGEYQVVLHFAEPYWGVFSSGNGHGVRIFDVLVEGTLVRDNMDIVQEVGPHQELVVTHVANVQDGVLTLEFDASANDPIINAIEVIEIDNSDNDAPSTPTGLAVSAVTETSADLNWNAATDNVGITGYYIYDNGSLLATTTGTGTTLALSNLNSQTPYQISIAAYDAAGNTSAPSTPSLDFTTAGGSGGGYWTQTGADLQFTSGNVGIGVGAQGNYALAVGGKIISEEVKVQLQSNWPDYVFTDTYELPTLVEVKRHIDEKGHLINIPSGSEVTANGLQLGEMNRLLLEKIEELTLYTLQQEQQLKKLNQQNDLLESRLRKLETQIKN